MTCASSSSHTSHVSNKLKQSTRMEQVQAETREQFLALVYPRYTDEPGIKCFQNLAIGLCTGPCQMCKFSRLLPTLPAKLKILHSFCCLFCFCFIARFAVDLYSRNLADDKSPGHDGI